VNRTLVFLAALAAVGVGGAVAHVLADRKSETAPDTHDNAGAIKSMLASSEPATGVDPAEGGGIFKVEKQVLAKPVIAIRNDSPYDLRLFMEDIHGLTETDMIGSGTARDITIPEGDFQAQIDAPDAPFIPPTQGTVEVRNFRHYEADFVLAPTDGSPRSFHIGD
jgi:hypothetical protein